MSSPIFTSPVPRRVYENNAQHIGAPRQSADFQVSQDDSFQMSVPASRDFTRQAAENAAHTGALQAENKDQADPEAQAPSNPQQPSTQAPAQPNVPQNPDIIYQDPTEPVYPIDPENPQVQAPDKGQEANEGQKAGEGNQAGQAQEAADFEKMQKERDEVNKILLQMAEDRAKWFAEIMKIIRETQDAITEIILSSTADRANTFSKCNAAWSDAFRKSYDG